MSEVLSFSLCFPFRMSPTISMVSMYYFFESAKPVLKGVRMNIFLILLLFYPTDLVCHCHQFLGRYGVIHNLNCQPVENKHHLQSQAFPQGSQKGGRGHSYTLQVT